MENRRNDMRSRILSLTLCIVLALTLVPSVAFAASTSGDSRAVYEETDDGTIRASQVVCYDGCYFINYPSACSIVRMKTDGTEIKQIVDPAGLGLLTSIDALYADTVITDKSITGASFVDIACYNGKLYVQKMINARTKDASCEFLEMDLNGQNQRTVFTLSASDLWNASTDAFMSDWVISDGNVWFYQNQHAGEGAYKYCSYPLSGGNFTYYDAWGYYYDGKLFDGDYNDSGDKFNLTYYDLSTGEKVVYKTIAFVAKTKFVAEGYAYIWSSNNYWRIAIDGSEQGKNSEFIGWADGGLSAYQGDLYYGFARNTGNDSAKDAHSYRLFKSEGMGAFHDRVQLNFENNKIEYCEQDKITSPVISGRHAFIINRLGFMTQYERAVYAIPLDGSQSCHALYRADEYYSFLDLQNKYIQPGMVELELWSSFYSRPSWEQVAVLNREILIGCSPWAEGYLKKDKLGESTNDVLFGSEWKRPITRMETCYPIINMAYSFRKFPEASYKHEAYKFPFRDTFDHRVCIAWCLGITDGVSATKFNPKGQLTRQEMATMIYRTIKTINTPVNANVASTNMIPLTRGSINDFSDEGKVASWAREAMEYMVGMGLMNGVGNNRLDPQGKCTIEQCYAICYRVMEMGK